MRLKEDHTLAVIVAAVVLHNIALMMGDDEPSVDELLSCYIQRMRLEGMPVDFDPVEVAAPEVADHVGAFGVRQALIDKYFN